MVISYTGFGFGTFSLFPQSHHVFKQFGLIHLDEKEKKHTFHLCFSWFTKGHTFSLSHVYYTLPLALYFLFSTLTCSLPTHRWPRRLQSTASGLHSVICIFHDPRLYDNSGLYRFHWLHYRHTLTHLPLIIYYVIFSR